MAFQYDLRLVSISLAISILASWVAIDLSGRIHLQRSRRRKVLWLCAGSAAMGIGIWSMHYVGMLAYRMTMPVLYDWPTVLLSMFAAVFASGIALSVVNRATLSWGGTVLGGFCMGGAIAGMHYIGMAAMRMPSNLHYSWPMVALSVGAAVVISMAGLRLTFGSKTIARGWSYKKAGSALLMGVAIPTMHYLGMAAAKWSDGPGNYVAPKLRHALEISALSTTGIILVTILVLIIAVASAGVDRRVSRFESDLDGSLRRNVQLRQHTEHLQAAFRAGGVGIWECDPATGLFYVDASLRELYGLPPSDEPVPREVWKAQVHPNDVQRLDECWAKCLAESDLYESEYRLLTSSGDLKRVRSVASIFRSATGLVERVLGMTWDVTAERLREEQTEELAARFRTTLEAIGDAVISTDDNLRVTFLNRAASELTGWSVEEGHGKLLGEIFMTDHASTGELCADPVRRCIESGGSLQAEDGVLVSRTGTRHRIRKHVSLLGNGSAAVLTFQDITEAQHMKDALVYAASHDSLTGLPNRAAFEKRLQALWADNRTENRVHCLCILDLDRFKVINDTSGHLAGDAFLREIAGILERQLRASDCAARMGGDEFMLLLVDSSAEEAVACVTRLLETIKAFRFPWQDRLYDVTASAGVVAFDHTSPDPEVLISQADVAVFTAKRHGRDRVSLYTEDEDGAARHHQEMKIVASLRKSFEDDRFELYAQPIVEPFSHHEPCYFELLIRMRDSNGELILPSYFIPAAERYGLMGTVDRWVIRKALDTYSAFGAEALGIRFAINLSAESVSDPTLWRFVSEEFSRTGVAPSSITFEVTETGVIRNLKNAKEFMLEARRAGSRIALDDFGTGLSSLSYLKQFPLDTIKVDGAFVRNLASNPLDQAIVRSVAEIARSMRASTVAECVEDAETIRVVDGLGVDYVQGWATGKPLPLEAVLLKACTRVASVEEPVSPQLIVRAA